MSESIRMIGCGARDPRNNCVLVNVNDGDHARTKLEAMTQMYWLGYVAALRDTKRVEKNGR